MLAEIQFGPFAIEHPESLIATVLGVLLLAFLWYRSDLGGIGYPAIHKGVTERAVRIEESQTQADRQVQDIQNLRNDYASRLANFEVEQRERIAAAVRDSDKAKAEIIADAQAAALAAKRRGEEELARERTRYRILMRQQLVNITLDAAEQSVRSLNTPDVQRRLIADFIGSVGAGTGSGASARNGATPPELAALSGSQPSPTPALSAISTPPAQLDATTGVAGAEPADLSATGHDVFQGATSEPTDSGIGTAPPGTAETVSAAAPTAVFAGTPAQQGHVPGDAQSQSQSQQQQPHQPLGQEA